MGLMETNALKLLKPWLGREYNLFLLEYYQLSLFCISSKEEFHPITLSNGHLKLYKQKDLFDQKELFLQNL